MGIPSPEGKLTSISSTREKLLQTAPTVPPELDTTIDHIHGLDSAQIASNVLAEHKGRPLIQPRGGFGRFEEQRELTKALSEIGADFLPLTIDSHTRHNDYATAGLLLERSQLENSNLLNGYPLVNHGYQVTRKLYDGLQQPVSLRHGTPDARLLVEIALASGLSEIEGGALSYTIPYTRGYPLVHSLLHWQYVDRVCALVSTAKAPIHRESFGVLSATLVPPVMVVVVELCELLLAAEQGVISFSVSFSQTGSFIQDQALAKVLRELSKDYLDRFGFSDVSVYLVYHQWMGPFPEDVNRANDLIMTSAHEGQMLGADKIVIKTNQEAKAIPTIACNVESVNLVRDVLENEHGVAQSNENVKLEAGRIRKQVKHIMEKIFDLDPPSFWCSVNVAYERGYIDIPFSPHCGNRNKLLTCRGRDKGIYIVDPGQVPIPADTFADEQAALEMRIDSESFFKTLVADINLMQ